MLLGLWPKPTREWRRKSPCPLNMNDAGGEDFEHLQTASQRLLLIPPVVLVVISLLLHLSFCDTTSALKFFKAVPVAASGGLFALAWRSMPFSFSAGFGLIASFGVAVLEGLVWVSAA
jgi:cobalt-zinc-cadmium resistance protein CzcA